MRSRWAAALALALVSGCGGGTSSPAPTSPSTPVTTTLVVTGWTQPLNVGEQATLSATAVSSDGSSRIVTDVAVWESSNPTVATVNKGLVTGMAPGVAGILATFDGKQGNQGISVAEPTPVPPPPSPPPGLACGVERWFVKTLADNAASRVDVTSVTSTTIRDLNGFATHCTGLPDSRTYAEEFRVFEVTGRIIYIAHEDDRDYHIALEDPGAPGYTLVSELADTVCAGAVISPHFTTLRTAEAMWAMLLGGRGTSALIGTTVRVRGVGFYDFNHGQTGRSRNCIELHPILGIDR